VSVDCPATQLDPLCVAFAAHVLHAVQVNPSPYVPALHWHATLAVLLHADNCVALGLQAWQGVHDAPLP
jgi:hypothetical protein